MLTNEEQELVLDIRHDAITGGISDVLVGVFHDLLWSSGPKTRQWIGGFPRWAWILVERLTDHPKGYMITYKRFITAAPQR